MRCPDCQKFVSYEDPPTVEAETPEIADDTVSVEMRVVLRCDECGGELKEANLSAEADFERLAGCEHDLEVETVSEEGASRLESKDRYGKPIKSYRYMKTFYGGEVTVKVSCRACDWEEEIVLTAEEQASGFEELV